MSVSVGAVAVAAGWVSWSWLSLMSNSRQSAAKQERCAVPLADLLADLVSTDWCQTVVSFTGTPDASGEPKRVGDGRVITAL
jgi:hypothetical protein